MEERNSNRYSGGQRRAFATRYIALAVLFALTLFVYLSRLWSLGAGNNDLYFTYNEGNLTSYTVEVKASRGAICDRNGKVLVQDRETDNLIFNYNSMPSDNAGINGMILYALEALRKSGNADKRVSDVFPFDGTYPNYTPKAVLADGEAVETLKLIRFLENRGLAIDSGMQKILDKMLTKYGLLDKKGNLIYTEAQTHELLVTRYDMESKDFGAYQSYTLAEDVDVYLAAYVRELPYPGAELEQIYEREYLYPGYASHILGRVSKIYAENWDYYRELGYKMTDTVGVGGCEEAFESYLRGVSGRMRIYVDADGNIVRMEMEEEPRKGYDVYLTIDADMQVVAENALAKNIADIVASSHGSLTGEDCNAGGVVATDPDTGEILAVASYPTYDLSTFGADYNRLSTDAALPLFNRALEGTYAPGSTFKLGIALAALEEGVISPSTIINTKGIYTYYDSYHPRCWLYLSTGRSHGPINVTEAVRVSCNYFFYDIGRLMGIDTMTRYCTAYGLGQKTGVELPEATGVLAGPAYRDNYGLAEWNNIDTLMFAIGQSDNLFTPLSICQYTAAITNGGTRYAAHLLSRVVEFGTGEVIYEKAPEVLSSFTLSDSSVRAVKEGMRQVIYRGTSASLSSYFSDLPASVIVGGKTGTAQVRATESDNGVFTCVAPLDSPEITVTVLIERAGGGSAVAYTASRILSYYFAE